MKKIYTFLAVIIFLTNVAYTQTWEYSQHIAATTKSELRGLTLDSDTNLYVVAYDRSTNGSSITTYTGPFGSVDYDGTGRKQDILLAKLDQTGDTLWTKHFGGADSDYGFQVALDNNDNPYIAGQFRSAIFPIQGKNLLQVNSFDIFLAKYTKTGGNDFANLAAYGTGDQKVNQIATDNNNNVYMLGNYKTEITFGSNDSTIYSTPYSYGLFLAKYAANGDFIWARNITTTDASAKTELLEIDVATNEELYLGGYFYDSLTIGDSTIVAQGTAEDLLVIKIDSSGAPLWLRHGGAPDVADRCNGITTDENRNLYLTGYISGTAKLDSLVNGDLGSSSIVSAGGTDMIMAKYNPDGQLVWQQRNGSIGDDKAYGAKIRENILLFTGYFADTVQFNNTTISTPGSSDENTGFFVYDIDGNPITAQSIGGYNSNQERGEYIEYDIKGNVYVGGYFNSDTIYIGSSKYANASTGNNAFVGKYQNQFSATFSTQTDITCPGGNDGALSVTTYFGTSPYTFDWSASTGSGSFTNENATNLSGGYYEVTITDALSHQVTINYTLNAPNAIDIDLDSTNLSCYQSADGIITTNVTGGTSPYTYDWTGVSGYDLHTQNQSGVWAGWYKVTVTDDNSCVEYDSILVLEPNPISSTATVTDAPFGSSTGSIDLDVSGGTTPYNYVWKLEADTMIGRTYDTLKNLAQGKYTALVTDDNGCAYDTAIYVLGQDLRVSLIGTDVSCHGLNNGIVLARIVSGDEGNDYIYGFKNGSKDSITATSDTTVTNLSPGWYFVTAYEQGGNNRQSTDSVEITQPDTITLGVTPTNASCYGYADGSVSLLVSGGLPTYEYSWSNGANTESVPNLASGWYTVTVTDQNNCEAVDSAFVDQPAELTANIAVTNQLDCYGHTDGSLQALVTGGDTPYQYAWDDIGLQTGPIASNLEARTYSVVVTDNKNCRDTATIDLTQPDPLSISNVDSNNIKCFNTLTGRIAVEMSGGTKPYTYSWDPGTHGDTNVIYNLLPQIYSLTVTDDNGCINDSLSIDIKNPQSQLKVSEDSAANNICYGDTNGYIRVTAAGGWGNYEYSIDGNSWHSENIFDSLASNIYTIQVRDASGCIDDLGIEIDGPTADIALIENLNGNTIIIVAYNGTGPYNYSLNGGDPQTNGNFSDLQNGNYYVEVTDANGCGPIRSKDFVVDMDALAETSNDLAGVMPNPTNGEFYLVFNNLISDAAKIEVYSITGAKVYENSFEIFNSDEPVKIDIQEAPNGIYLIKVNNKLLKTKLIKQ